MTKTIIKRHIWHHSLLASLLLLAGCDLIKDIPVGTGYAAKQICSSLFVSGLDRNTVIRQFVAPQVKQLPLVWNVQIDDDNKTVSVRDTIFINQNLNVAYYREGFGCTLLHDATPEQLDAQLPPLYSEQTPADIPWPWGNGDVESRRPDIDYAQLDAAVEHAFEQDSTRPANTLAVAVVHDGHLIAERYGFGADRNSRFVSWSMAKSFTATLVGLLVDQGRLALDEPAPVPEWAGTEKSAITLTHLLHMASGLQWSESDQGKTPDRGRMLFLSPSHPDYYLQKPLEAEPGTLFTYSTGVTNMLARIVQDEVGGTLQDTYHFIHQSLFHPLGIEQAVLEFDTVGNPVAGASLYMSARDWARLGLLYAQRGEWFGQQILSPEWVDFALTPSPANPAYGAQIWLNRDKKMWPYLPEDSFAFRGFHHQVTLVVPQHNLILVRQGVSFEQEDFDLQSLVTGIIASLPDTP